jgi:hypothetical protein
MRIAVTEKRFMVHADEKLTAFMELESAIFGTKNHGLLQFRARQMLGALRGFVQLRCVGRAF